MLRSFVDFLLVANWRITLVLVLGAVAIYLLLPRPRGYPPLWGAAAGGLALLAAGALLLGVGAVSPEVLLFYSFSAIAVCAGGLLVTQRNPARAALSFALVVLSTAGLFLLLAAPFLMAATVIIYAGAIVVTFLFVIMLAQQEGLSDPDNRSREPLLSTVAGFVLLGGLLYVLHTTYETSRIDNLLTRTDQAIERLEALIERREGGETSASVDWEAMEELLKDYKREGDRQANLTEYERFRTALTDDLIDLKIADELDGMRGMQELLKRLRDKGQDARTTLGSAPPVLPKDAHVSELSGPASTRTLSELRRDDDGRPQLPAENTQYLGRSLFTDYVLAVELGGTLLLVAAIGAIAIATRRPPNQSAVGGRQ